MNIKTTIYKRVEIILHSDKNYENPFLDVDIDAVFTCEDGTVIKLPGFWNGDNEWKVRFSPNRVGTWNYTVTSTDKENASLTDTGVIDASPCVNPTTEIEKHGFVRIEEGKRYMVYDDGTPFFYLADTHWMMADFEHLHECNYPGCSCGNAFKHLADDRIKKGFNVYQTYFESPRMKPYSNGVEGWWLEPYTKINPKAFNESMDIMIEYLAQNGITTAMGFGAHSAVVVMFGEQAVEALPRFAKYCVARYACYPLIWFTGQEITQPEHGAFDIWKKVAETVCKYDGYHRPEGAHMFPMTADDWRAQDLHSQPWHKWFTLQAGHGGYVGYPTRFYYKGYYDLEPIKPFIEAESQYEDVFCSGFCGHNAVRQTAWQAVQCGSAGFTYGSSGIWVSSWDQKTEPSWTDYSPDSWYEAMDKPGSTHMSYLKKFYDYVGWYKLKPSFDYEFGIFESRSKIAISHIDKDVIIYYFFSKTEEAGILTGLKPSTRYQARLFDPIVGKFIDLEDIIATDAGTADMPKLPSLRDWVLLLNTFDMGEYETYTYPVKYSAIPPQDAKIGDKIEIKSIRALSEDDEYPITNTLDGNPETYWHPHNDPACQRVWFDLGQEEEIGYLYLQTNMPMRFQGIRVFGSNDGENYELIVERNERNIALGDYYNNYYETINKKYRYIELFINSHDLVGGIIEKPKNHEKMFINQFAFYKKA